MKRFLALIVALAAGTGLHLAAARADTSRAKLIPLPNATPLLIPELHLQAPDVQTHDSVLFAKIKGTIHQKDGSLLLHLRGDKKKPNKQYIHLEPHGENGNFETEIPLAGPSTELEFLAIDPYGAVKRQRTLLLITDWVTKSNESLATAPTSAPLALDVGLGGTDILLTQTGKTSYSEFALTAKLGIRHSLFSPHFDWNLSGYGTLLPISESYSASARFVGANLKFGYRIPGLAEPWAGEIWLGGYYATMFVAANAFGYQNAVGPELFAYLRRTLRSSDAIQGYLKASLVSDSSDFTFDSREIAIGLSYVHPILNGHPLCVGLDGSVFRLASNAAVIEVNTFSLGASFGF